MSYVRWGILGAAEFAAEHMGPALHAASGGTLAALATSSDDKAARFRDIAPGLTVHLDYDALLSDPEVDAIYIPLPNHLHVEWTKKALAAGKHVLCEKPMAMQAAEFDELIAQRDETGLVCAEAYMIVHHPQWQKARELVQGGAIGQLVDVDVRFSFNNPDPGNIRNKPETGGGGLPDIGVYAFGCTRFVTGEEPEEITAAEVTWEDGVDTRARVLARFPSFAYAGMVSTRMAPAQQAIFHGTEGVLRLTAPFNATVFGDPAVILEKGGAEAQVWRFSRARQYDLQVAAFNRSVLNGEAYPCPLEFSRGTQAMIDMVYAKAGR